MPDQRHEAFSIEYPYLSSELFTEVELFNPGNMDRHLKTFALWDTGATVSSIAPSVIKKLGLEPVDSIMIERVNSLEKCDLVVVHVGLPNKLIVPNVKPSVCVFGPPDLEFIIGMDIIKLGDFVISNAQGKTLFSFAAPPLPEKINLVDRANHLNNYGDE